jgi:hypothetical protein
MHQLRPPGRLYCLNIFSSIGKNLTVQRLTLNWMLTGSKLGQASCKK